MLFDRYLFIAFIRSDGNIGRNNAIIEDIGIIGGNNGGNIDANNDINCIIDDSIFDAGIKEDIGCIISI